MQLQGRSELEIPASCVYCIPHAQSICVYCFTQEPHLSVLSLTSFWKVYAYVFG